MATLPDEPLGRKETYLAAIAGEDVTIPEPLGREEMYLAYIAENGGSGGTTNYNDLTNKPKINGVTLQGDKDAEDLSLAGLGMNTFTQNQKINSANYAGMKLQDGDSPNTIYTDFGKMGMYISDGDGVVTKAYKDLLTKNDTALTGTTTAENITISGDLTVDSVDVETSITVPTPSDNTDAANKGYVDTADSALDTRITNLQNIGRFLAIWNCATGLPTSNPTTSPYAYKTGDYYRVGTIGDGYSHALAMTGATTSVGTYSGDYTLNFTIKTQSNTQLTTAAEVIAAMDGSTRYTATGTLTTADNTYTITSVLKWLDGSTYYIAICDANEEKLALISTSTTLTDTVTGGLVSYMPSGSSYTTGVASTTVYSGTDLSVGSVFYYDGTNWLLQAAGSGGTVQDVQVNGTSILSGGVANLPLYTSTGTNTDGPMTQNAVTSMVYADPSDTVTGAISIGTAASTYPKTSYGDNSIVIGHQVTSATPTWSAGIAIGSGAYSTYGGVIIGNSAGPRGYAKGNNSVCIGTNAVLQGNSFRSVVIGDTTSGNGRRQVIIGNNASISGEYDGAIALGSYSGSNVTAAGMMDISSSDTGYGYNSSNYRLLTGLYDPQSDHDAATKGYVDGTTESYTIASTDWTSLSGDDPYTYSTEITATHTIGDNTVVALLNDQASLFATYGFAVAAVSEQNLELYSIGQPSADVTLKINYKG